MDIHLYILMGRQFYTKAYLERHQSDSNASSAGTASEGNTAHDASSDFNTGGKMIGDQEQKQQIDKSKTDNKPKTATISGKKEKEQQPTPKQQPNISRKPVAKPKPKLREKDARTTEIDQLRLRFTDLQVTDTTNDIKTVTFMLPITDPDFPYDLPAVHLQVTLPPEYPHTSPPTFAVLNPTIPSDIKRRLETRLNDTVRTMAVGELSVRPMLRYLERNLEAIIAAKTAIKFIPPTAIRVSPSTAGSAGTNSTDGTDGSGVSVCVPQPPSTSTESPPQHKEHGDNNSEMKLRECRFEPGTFIKLQPVKELGGGSYLLEAIQHDSTILQYGLLVLCSLSLTVVCQKCSAMTDIMNIRIESERLQNCVRCKRQMSVEYYPQYMTTDNKVIGQCRFVKCRPLDLLPSQWQMECAQCEQNVNGESGVRVAGVKFGEVIKYPCRRCGSVMSLGVDGCRWTERQPLVVTGSKTKQEKVAVTIGEPLPDYGACEHYSKSYRWYRFPCCGRVFPCDRCHDAAQTHPMEWATRFLCGFCSREQHINNVNKVCQCGADPAKRHTAHWEGGKGMREQATMSRKDNKKYRGLSR